MFKQTTNTNPNIPVTTLVSRVFRFVLFFVALTGVFLYTRTGTPAPVYAATPNTLNFQARLLTGSGSIVPDGTYNVEFKLYNALTSTGSSQGSCAGDAACVWTETRLTTDAAALRVNVRAGYLSVVLGDKTAFTSVNWDQQLYLTMNIGTTAVTPVWDGEMSPRLKLTSVPYAQQAARANQLSSSAGANTGTLSFGTLTNNPVIALPNASGTVALLQGTQTFTGATTFSGTGTALTVTNNATVGSLTVSGTTTLTGLNTAGIVTNTAAGVLGTTPTVPVANGGTNIASYTTGDLLYASGATTLARLADVAAGSCLISGGVGVAPAYGSCGGAGGGANTALSNLTATSINQSLIANANNTFDLGSAAIAWRTGYFGTSVVSPIFQTADSSAALATTGAVSLRSGNAVGLTSNSGAVTIDVGSATLTAGTVTIAGVNASALTLGRSGLQVSVPGGLTSTGNIAQTGATTFSTGTGAISLNGATSVTGANTFSSGTGAVTLNGATSISGTNTLTVGTGATSLGGTLSVTGAGTYTGLGTFNGGLTVSNNSNFVQTGTGTFGTGSGAVSLNGATSVTGTNTLTVGTGATSLGGTLTVSGSTTLNGSQLTNNGSTLNTAQALGNYLLGGSIGANTTTVDVDTSFTVAQTSGGQTLSLPNPTVTTAGRIVYVANIGSVSFVMHGVTIGPGNAQAYIWNGSAWVATNIDGSGSGGVTTIGTIDTQAKSANGAVISGNSLFLQTADPSSVGLVSTGAQTFAGAKTFNSALTVSAGGIAVTGNSTIAGTLGSLTGLSSSGAITFSGLGAGLVQAAAGGGLSSGAVDRNSATYFNTTLSVANGGTGAGTFTTNGILFGNGTGAVQATIAAANSILATNGTNVPSLTQTLPTVVQGNITTVGTIGSGLWNGTALTDTYVSDTLTIGSAGNVDWTALNNYPASATCAAGSAVTVIADTITCAVFASGSGSASYIQNGTVAQNSANFNIQSVGTANVTAKLRANTSQTADIIQVRDATDATTVFAVSPSGAVTATSLSTSSTISASNFSGSSSGTNTGNVTLAGQNYLSISGQVITANQINLTSNVTGILPATNGGTGNGFTAFTGATTATKTYTLPDASTTILTTNAAVTVGQGGTGVSTLALNGILYGNGTSAIQATTAAANSILITSAGNVPSLSQTLPTAVQGNITSVGTIGSGVWNGTALTDTYVSDTLTIGVSSTVEWTALNNYPASATCTAGSAVTQIADTITCAAFAAGSGSTNYIQNGTTAQNSANFNIQSVGTANVTVKLRANTSQTADIIQVRDSTDVTTVFSVTPAGAVTATSFAGDGSSLTALNATQLTSGTVPTGRISGSYTGITGLGTITVGIWNGTALTDAFVSDTLTSSLFVGAGSTSTAIDLATSEVNGILGAANGGTGNGFTAFTGATTATKTYTLPDASTTILTTNAAVTVAQGGTGTNTLTAGGILYGNGTGAITNSGVLTNGQLLIGDGAGAPTVATLTQGAGITVTNGAGSITIASTLGTSISNSEIDPDAVTLGTQTSGSYVAGITTGNGLQGGNSGEGITPTLSLSSLTADWNQSGAFDIVLNNSSSELRIMESIGGIYYGTLDVADLAADKTYVLPNFTGTTADICLSTGNCTGIPGSVDTAGGTANRLAKFQDSNTLTDSILTDNGSLVTIQGTAAITGSSSLTLGTSLTATGAILFRNATNANVLTLQSGATGAGLTLTLPTADGSNTDCLKTNGAGVLSFAACTGGAGGGVTSVNAQSGVLTLQGTTNQISVVSGSGTITLSTPQNIHSAASPTFAGLTLSGDLAVNGGDITSTSTLTITPAANTNLNVNLTGTGDFAVNASQLYVDTSTARVGIGTATPSTKLDVQGGVVSQNGYQLADAATDNMVADGDMEQGVYGWTSFGGAGTISSNTTDRYSGQKSMQVTGMVNLNGNDFIPVDPTRDVLQLEAYVKKSVAGTTPGTLYFGYLAYDANKTIITTAPCGSYCYFAASAFNLPADGNWHKLSATTTGEGTVYPNFPVGTKFVQVMGLVNYTASADAVTLIDHVTLKRINHGPLFVGNNFNTTNLTDQYQQTQLYTNSSSNFVISPGGSVIQAATNNAIDLGLAGTSFRTGYFGTSVLTPAIDTITAGTLSLGTTTANAITIGKAGVTTTVGGALSVTGAITGSSTIQGTQLISTIATGTAPLTVASTTRVANLNADLLDGLDSTAFQVAGSYAPASGSANYIQNTTVQQTANFNISGTGTAATFTAGTYQVNGTTAITADSYLRINQGNTFTNGIWLGTSALRAQTGGIYLGSTGGDGQIALIPTGADQTRRITLNGGDGSISAGAITSGLINGQTISSSANFTGTVAAASTVQGTQLISTVANGTAPLSVTSSTMVSNFNSNYLGGLTEGALGENLRAQANLSGGGTISWTAGNLSWTTRLIVISNSISYIDLNMPAVGTVIAGVGGSAGVTVTASGIPLPVWQALYYVPATGTYRVASYTGAAINSTSGWILIAVYNGDNASLKLGTGLTLLSGQTSTNGVVNNAQFNTSATSPLFVSTVATGTAPLTVASTTKVTNLNADLLDGLDSTAFALASGSGNYIQNTTTQQPTSNFNISGAGVIGTTLNVGGNVNIGGGLSGRRLDVYNSANNGDGLAVGQDTDNSQTIQSYIDGQWTNRTTYAGGCCNLLKLQPDVGAVQLGASLNVSNAGVVSGAGTYNGQTISSAANFTGTLASGAITTSGNLTYTTSGIGAVSVYDPAKTQAIWSMGAAYALPPGGGVAGNMGNLYGLGWSYEPDFGGVGNNPQSKAGLGFQQLLMQNGVTQTAIGTGVWTNGTVTATNFSGPGTNLTGTAASLNIGGNAGTVTNGVYTNTTNTLTGVNYFLSNKGATSTLGANNSYALEAFSNDGGAAALSLHRGGAFAVNFGLDPDNVLRIGGWSAAANLWQLDMSGNQTLAGRLNSATGYQVAGAAATGTYLRGNGTNFVGSAIQAADLPAGSGSYIQNTTVQQAGSNFNISGAGVIGSTLAVTGAVTGGTYNGQTISSAANFTGTISSGAITSTGYSTFGALRLNGVDATNTIWQSNANTNLAITANGGDVSLGQTSTQQLIVKASGNVGIGAVAPDTKLEVRGATLNSDAGGAVNYYRNVAQGYLGAATQTGTLKIALPTTWTDTMLSITIKGYDYSTKGAWEVVVGGYNCGGCVAWINTSAEIRGKAPFTQVRLAHDGTKNVILLGTTTSTWEYASIEVTDVAAGYNAKTGWGSGWTIGLITTETGIASINTPVAPITVAPGNDVTTAADLLIGGGDLTLTGTSTINGGGAQSVYGAVSVNGTKNGWGGINFRSGATNLGTLMVTDSIQGFLNEADNAWDWYFTNGVLTAGAIPAANVAAGTFGAGNFTMQGTLTLPGFVSITGAGDAAGNLRFTAPNPYIVSSSYVIMPGGAYFNSGIVYTEATLAARGGIADDGGVLELNDDVNIGAGDLYVTNSSGNVGIGTATNTFGAKLEVNGDIYFSSGASRSLKVAAPTTANASGGSMIVQSGNGNGTGPGGLLNLEAGLNPSTGSGGGIIQLSGGTTTTGGQVSISGGTNNSGTGGIVYISGGQSASSVSSVTLQANSGYVHVGNFTQVQAKLAVLGNTNDSTAGALSLLNSSFASLLYVRNDGNVGIGNVSPGSKLDVNGNINSSGSLLFNGATTNGSIFSSVAGYLNVRTGSTGLNIDNNAGSANLLAITNGGNVGIGTSGPTARLHVVHNIANLATSLENTMTTLVGTVTVAAPSSGYTGLNVAANFSPTSGTGNLAALTGVSSNLTLASSGNIPNAFGFYTKNNLQFSGGTITNAYGVYVAAPAIFSGSITNRYAFVSEVSAGRVGIGTITPNNQLGVVGNIAASGTITGGVGAPDYAENITASDPTIEAADVVSLDPNKKEQIIKSTKPYEAGVLGIISTNPGFVTNAQLSTVTSEAATDPLQRPLALSGRVPVKVTNENGPIAPGDYLTSSSTPGHAMKATKAGLTIGRALEGFDGVTGKVLVFVSSTYADPTDQSIQASNGSFTSLNVDGEAKIKNLVVSGTTTTKDLVVTGIATIQNLTVVDAITTNNLTVAETATIKTLKVTENAEFAGDIKLTGVGNSRNAITKKFKASKAIAIGDVVIADPENDGQVTTTVLKADRKVLGIATTSAVNAGDEIEVAIGGLVQVKFDTATIVAGDLIISSDVEGNASTAPDDARVGSVLGKATSKKDAQGMVWILVTLQ